jgi:hypothetical protein
MTNRFQGLGGALLTCTVLLTCGAGRDVTAQGKPAGPPVSSDGFHGVAVLFDDVDPAGLKVLKSDKVVVDDGKRVDFYLVNLADQDVDFYVEFFRGGKSVWFCNEKQRTADNKKEKKRAEKRGGDGALVCTLNKLAVADVCGIEKKCLVNFFYKFTAPGSETPLKFTGDPQLEIRR